jgi:hypothetical protein
MCDFFDDFDDNYDEGASMDDDSFEDEYDADTEMDDPLDGDSDFDGEPDDAESKDDFTAKEAFVIGAALGFAYEQGLREQKRRKGKRFSDDSD